MYETWWNYRNDQCTGKLDRAFASKDYALLREALDELKTTNREFAILIAQRYAEMLTNDPVRH